MKRFFALLAMMAIPGIAGAPPGEKSPGSPVTINKTHDKFKLTGFAYDDKKQLATIIYESVTPGNAFKGYHLTITLDVNGGTVQKGRGEATAACTNGSYTITSLITDIDADANGLLLGLDAAFDACY